MFLVYLIPNDNILVYYHFGPYVISYFRCFCIFILLVWVYKPLYFCNPKQLFIFITVSRSFHFRVSFALFSLFFLSFSRLPNTPLEDDNSRDAWLSLIALKRRVAGFVLGLLQVVLLLSMIRVLHLWFHTFQTRV